MKRGASEIRNAMGSMRHAETIRVRRRGRRYAANVRLSIFAGVGRGKYGNCRREMETPPQSVHGEISPIARCPLSRIFNDAPSRRRRPAVLLASAAERRECTAARPLYLS